MPTILGIDVTKSSVVEYITKEHIIMARTRSPLEEAVLGIIKEEFNEIVNVDKLNSTIDNKVSSLKNEISLYIDSLVKHIAEDNDNHPKHVEVNIKEVDKEEITKIEVGVQHKEFPTLIKLMSIRSNIYIYGPTGSGKSRAAITAAEEVFKLPVYIQAVYPQAPTSLLMGYNTASGSYCEGIAYKPYTNGGVLVIDELDNGSAASNLAINMLTNNVCYFPNGMTRRHKDFFIIATANTVGNGADRKYVGRSMQDKALLNRFVYLNWRYDKRFERELAIAEYQRFGGKDIPKCESLIEDFWKMRQAIDELNVDHILSPRNLIEQQCRMLAAGIDLQTIARCCIARGIEGDQWRKIHEKAGTLTINKDEDESSMTPKQIGYGNPFDKKLL